MTSDEIDKAYKKADEMMKASKGHYFQTVLKTRCMFCGRSPKVKTKCGKWFQTYLLHLKAFLMDPKTMTDASKNLKIIQ